MTKKTTLRHALLAATSALTLGVCAAQAQDIAVYSGYPELGPFYEHVAAGMDGTYPDLKVHVEPITLREHERRVALGLTSGFEMPTVIELSTSTAGRYIENQLMQPAPDAVVGFVSDPANFDDFFEASVSRDGTIYGVPLFRGQGALYYNKKMFAEAGLTEAPKTMDEFTDYAAKLVKRDAAGKPTVSGWSLRLSGGSQGITEKWWLILFNHGGELLEAMPDGKWRAAYASDAGVKALSQYLDNVYKEKTVSVEMPADAEAFEREQTAMFIRESWVIGDIAAKAPALDYATAPLPRGSIALPANLYVAGAADDADAAKAAWDFALETNKPENLVWLLENVGWLPNRANIDYTPVTSKNPAYAAFVDYPQGYELFTVPGIAPIEEIQTRLSTRLQAAFENPALVGDTAAIRKLLEEAAVETNALLERDGILAN